MVNKDKKVGFRADGDKYEKFKEQCKKNELSPSMVLRKMMDNFVEEKVDFNNLFENYDSEKVNLIKSTYQKTLKIIKQKKTNLKSKRQEMEDLITEEKRNGNYQYEEQDRGFFIDPRLEPYNKSINELNEIINKINNEMAEDIFELIT